MHLDTIIWKCIIDLDIYNTFTIYVIHNVFQDIKIYFILYDIEKYIHFRSLQRS